VTSVVVSVVRTEGLTKHYGRLTAVDGVDLDVQEGDVFGFLGPNGSGKSTTIRMLLGLVSPSAGSIEVLGRSMPRHSRQVLAQVGSLVEGPAFYPSVSGRRNLSLFDAAGPGGRRRDRRRRIEEALERVGLGGVDRRPVRAYSMGMRQRLGIAAALIRGPRLLVLDEPTNGLDPQGIREMRELFEQLAASGTTVFLSSHLLAEVEQMCTRAAMMSSGRLVAQDTMARLLAPTGRIVVDTPDPEAARLLLTSLAGAHAVGDQEGRVTLHLNGLAPEAVNEALVREGVRVREFTLERRSLEDAYLDLTGGSGDVRR
jgi:ABC-2 type transport system ATP-binding protein